MEKILEVKDLHVSFHTYAGEVQAVRGVNFDLNKGETLAIVGESGSGKSVTTKTIMRLIPMPPGKIRVEKFYLMERIVSKTEKEMQKIRGKEIYHDLPGSNDFFKPNDENRKTNYGTID